MFRAAHSPLLAKVLYATLFGYNAVLQRVFEAPAGKVALSVEVPGSPKVDFTYGRLQEDVIAMADVLVARREAVARARGDAELSWAQASKPPHVRSVFAQGERTPSCDYMKDTGHYTAALMCGPGYPFVVSLLATWATNQLSTPMSVSQHYNDELMYVLEHSGCRSIIGETELLKTKFPSDYESLYVRAGKDVGRVSEAARKAATVEAHRSTFLVDSVVDAQSLINGDFTESRMRSEMNGAGREVVVPELLDPAEDGCTPMKSAEDVVARIERERALAEERERTRMEHILRMDHKARSAVPDDAAAEQTGITFDDGKPEQLNPLFRRWHEVPASQPTTHDDCLMIYTSGTTARPKGAVHTHASVSNMVNVLRDAWRWSDTDSILSVLPVHHVHGLVNVTLCALASHAHCVCTPFDDAARIAKRLAKGDISLFMGVPTLYTKLIAGIHHHFSPVEKTAFRNACVEAVRLMVCGSAALPVPTLSQFRELSGHTLLERYGMTEIGMALSQPLRPIEGRIPGTVGSPLPTVSCVVYQPEQTEDSAVTSSAEQKERQYDDVGALAIASDSLFDRYWNNPEATRKELRVSDEGQRLFDTGDTVGVSHTVSEGKPVAVFTILGRSSIDIIKSRGYKLSALEIEAALLSRKDLFYELAVVGSKDEVRGEKVVAVIAMQPDAAKARNVTYNETTHSYETAALTEEMREVSLEVLAPYKCPERFIFVPEIPRNPTGKVNKKNLKKLLHID